MSRLSLFACLACLVAGVGVAAADTPTYAVTSTGRFGTLDLDTGDFTAVGDIAGNGYIGIGNLADGGLPSRCESRLRDLNPGPQLYESCALPLS